MESIGAHVAHGSIAAFNFIIGDDLENLFGRAKSLPQRELAILSLASDFVPFRKLTGIGFKVLEHFGTALVGHAIGDGIARPGVDSLLSIVRDVGGIHPSFDLRAIERGLPGTSHTVLQHVAKDDAFLKSRIVHQGKEVASTYNDFETAQRSTDSIVGDPINQAKIQK